ncbi:MAG: amidohydrolase family protein [Flavobacteriaceae bacterium]|nr:amidohydrolase family protein [Flavobacteriaceae bacterium]
MKKILFLIVLMSTTVIMAQKTYLHCGTIVDVEKGKTSTNKTIVVEGNRIVQIANGFLKGDDKDVTVVDLKNMTVMPGFIDMHVHIEGEYNKNSYLKRFTDNDADTAFESTVFAERTLQAGFTSVRDLGGSGVNIALKKAIDRGLVSGPRVYTAGKAIGTTGGHADPTNGMKKLFMGDPGPRQGVINSADEARKAVRQRYKDGADCIKITATGGVLSVAKNGHNPQFTMEELQAIVSTAKDYGFLTAAHAHGDEGMQRAVKAGIHTIEHGTFMSETTMKLMKEKGTYLVATISAGKQVALKADEKGFYPAVVAKKAKEVGPQIQNTFARAYKMGVPIAFGTDAGVFPHGLNAIEFGYMVEAGMPEIEAIQSATIVNAKLLGEHDNLGQLKTGFLADIVAVKGNPLKNIKLLENIHFVMKNGAIYKQ